MKSKSVGTKTDAMPTMEITALAKFAHLNPHKLIGAAVSVESLEVIHQSLQRRGVRLQQIVTLPDTNGPESTTAGRAAAHLDQQDTCTCPETSRTSVAAPDPGCRTWA
jgi:hypothetical protein